MKLLTFTFLFLMGIQNLMAGPLEVKLRALLSSQNSCSLDGDDKSFYFETDEDVEGPKKMPCVDPKSDDFFIQVNLWHCRPRFGVDGQACVITDPSVVAKRVGNAELMKKMVDYTQNKFASYKAELVNECCKDKEVCRKRFNAVQFDVLPGEQIRAQLLSVGAPVTTTSDRIQMTMGKIASAYNTENIDRVLLAEFAHACQFAINSEKPEEFTKFVANKGCDIESGLVGFREGLGEEMSSCLMKEIESQIAAIPEAKRGNYCFGKWYREVFSDMMFRKHYTSIYHWIYDMSRRSQATNYASVYKYIRCGLPEELIQKVCK